MDVVAGTAFGLETNSQTQPAEPFVQSCKNMFNKMSGRRTQLLSFVGLFPFMSPLIRMLGKGFFTGEESDFLVHSVYRMVDERRQAIEDEKRTDFLQLLVNAEDTGLDVGQKRMTREEVAGQGFVILIAGYETTATTLQYLTYNLAKNQDVQQRVYEEMRDELGDILSILEDTNVYNSERPKNLTLYTCQSPSSPHRITRKALESRTIKGVTFPPVWEFSELKSSKLPSILLELPFGYGPRQCIGMRLALLEVKFAAVRIMRHFLFLPCEDTPDKIEFGKSGLTSPTKPIKLRTESASDIRMPRLSRTGNRAGMNCVPHTIFVADIFPPVVDKGLFFTGGSAWKRLRRLMTPTFTAGKLKNMSHFMDRCAKILKDNLREKTNDKGVIDTKDVFGAFTMDVITGTAFGLETNSQTQPAEPFRTDFLQLLVNAEDTGLDVGQKRMTREEVAGQGFVILIAGYETTATTLQYLTYNLAKNQDFQQRVYEEMRDELGDVSP
ncbi:hypothetical protein C0Q70_13348 [Pomacea canaliculata]|uniref:Cytochrome P450 n=1 Tax=Pomacea canaliculata TaxID=400727 RepID=A0A2T7NWZ4_POMCA|nr:hypothetical protein C0Q70_13348 [Pomacea canaliculata]